MVWDAAGQKIESLKEHYQHAQQHLLDNSSETLYIVIDDDPYLIRTGYYIPYFDPYSAEDEKITRERLNLELCHRIIRESEIRLVSRSKEAADEELKRYMREFEKEQFSKGRGKAVILFQNIVNRIRELAQDYLECAAKAKGMDHPSLEEQDIQEKIKELYEYVMVKQQGIMEVIRRSDGSKDMDGTIREMFSEIAKPYRVPLALIFESRATKIGKAMAAMDTVAECMISAVESATQTPKSQAIICIEKYSRNAKKLCGLPSFDHQVFNETSATCISTLDATYQCLRDMDYIGLDGHRRTEFVSFAQKGLHLIDDMQKLRDERPTSVKTYHAESELWIRK